VYPDYGRDVNPLQPASQIRCLLGCW